MGEALGLDKEKPNRVTKVAVKMLKCKFALLFKSSQSCGYSVDLGGLVLTLMRSAGISHGFAEGKALQSIVIDFTEASSPGSRDKKTSNTKTVMNRRDICHWIQATVQMGEESKNL